MATWLTYRPRDFLLFSPETYWRLFELTNAALWPLPLLTAPTVLLLLALALTGRRWARLGVVLGLAAGWVLTSETFLAARYEPINWAVAYVRPAFLVQAALLAAVGPRLPFPARGLRLGAGYVLLTLALAYPLVGLAMGRPLAQAEVFGIAPDPTAVGTLALLLVTRRSWCGGLLAVVPMLWLAMTCTTLHTMGEPIWLLSGITAVLALVSLVTFSGRERRVPISKVAIRLADRKRD